MAGIEARALRKLDNYFLIALCACVTAVKLIVEPEIEALSYIRLGYIGVKLSLLKHIDIKVKIEIVRHCYIAESRCISVDNVYRLLIIVYRLLIIMRASGKTELVQDGNIRHAVYAHRHIYGNYIIAALRERVCFIFAVTHIISIYEFAICIKNPEIEAFRLIFGFCVQSDMTAACKLNVYFFICKCESDWINRRDKVACRVYFHIKLKLICCRRDWGFIFSRGCFGFALLCFRLVKVKHTAFNSCRNKSFVFAGFYSKCKIRKVENRGCVPVKLACCVDDNTCGRKLFHFDIDGICFRCLDIFLADYGIFCVIVVKRYCDFGVCFLCAECYACFIFTDSLLAARHNAVDILCKLNESAGRSVDCEFCRLNFVKYYFDFLRFFRGCNCSCDVFRKIVIYL